MAISITLPDDLAQQVRQHEGDLPEILALGLREWHARQVPGFVGLSSVLETLAGLPAPEEVLALRPAPQVQNRIDDLLEKQKLGGLSSEEQREWAQFQFVEHLVRLAKAHALVRLRGT